MKTFEERYTAWIDGELTGKALADFESELARRGGAPGEQDSMRMLGDLLRADAAAVPLRNEDFFSHQLMERIRMEEAPRREQPRRPAFLWPLGRLAWSGAFCLLVAAIIFQFAIPKGPHENPSTDDYLAQAVSAHSDDPSISASAFHSNKEDATVVWLDGLDYLPASYVNK